MAKRKEIPLFNLGDYVRIRRSGFKKARIVELRGPLGPGGAQIYTVRVRSKPTPMYIEVRGDQLVPFSEPATTTKRKVSRNGTSQAKTETPRPLEVKTAGNTPLLKLGDTVRIRHSSYPNARIVELRGPLGPGGGQIYAVRVPSKPKPIYIEVREDQLVGIPDTAANSAQKDSANGPISSK